MLHPARPATAPEPSSAHLLLSPHIQKSVLVSLLLVGSALLLYKFPSVPVGLHQDEMSEAYESYSLLHTGADRWGYHLPIYFIGWGSGQNVLQAYLTIPIVAALGLTNVSARLVPLLCGLFTLPLFFFTLRRWFGENTALLGLLFLVVTPWHIMFSRWGVENSPLPFFMLLGIYTFGKALQSRSPWAIVPSLLPFALSLYTYGVVVVILPILFPLLFLIDPTTILKRGRAWIAALAAFCIAASPIAFFTVKNYVTKTNYTFERWLPFSVPLLPVSRLDQIHQENAQESRLHHNLSFIRHGFNDLYPHNQVNGVPPVARVLLLLAFIATIYLLMKAIRSRRITEPFLPAAIACLPVFLLMPADMSRCTALYIPLIALAAVGAGALLASTRIQPYGTVLVALCLLLLVLPTARFVHRYYGPTYIAQIAPTFHPDLPGALTKILQSAPPAIPIYVSEDIQLNYVDVLFLTHADPAMYQRSGATYNHPGFGRYRFSRETLARTPLPFAFLIKATDIIVCTNPSNTTRVGEFIIGECH